MTPKARYSVAEDVAWVEAADLGLDRPEAYVARLPMGPPLLMEGPAWAIWVAVADGGTIADITALAAELADVHPAEITSHVADFVRSLVDRGLVIRSAAAGPG